jgi:hypothetical protein
LPAFASLCQHLLAFASVCYCFYNPLVAIGKWHILPEFFGKIVAAFEKTSADCIPCFNKVGAEKGEFKEQFKECFSPFETAKAMSVNCFSA